MTIARLGALGLLASTALLVSCTTDNTGVQNALAQGSAVAATAPAQVDNFMLVDQNFEAHELYRMADAKLIAIVSHAAGDAEIKRLAPALTALRDRYADQGVEVLLINSNLKDDQAAIGAQNLKLPVLMDVHQLVGEQLGVTRSAELLLVNPKTWTVTYRGAAADAEAAIAAVLAGQAPPAGVSKGMAIAFPERARQAEFAKISYARDIAPILSANCVACHSEGGIGPFAMSNYDMVKGFAPMIREVIRTDRMPPYNADPHVGKFSDTRT